MSPWARRPLDRLGGPRDVGRPDAGADRVAPGVGEADPGDELVAWAHGVLDEDGIDVDQPDLDAAEQPERAVAGNLAPGQAEVAVGAVTGHEGPPEGDAVAAAAPAAAAGRDAGVAVVVRCSPRTRAAATRRPRRRTPRARSARCARSRRRCLSRPAGDRPAPRRPAAGRDPPGSWSSPGPRRRCGGARPARRRSCAPGPSPGRAPAARPAPHPAPAAAAAG